MPHAQLPGQLRAPRHGARTVRARLHLRRQPIQQPLGQAQFSGAVAVETMYRAAVHAKGFPRVCLTRSAHAV